VFKLIFYSHDFGIQGLPLAVALTALALTSLCGFGLGNATGNGRLDVLISV
jgi:hypothetical protein